MSTTPSIANKRGLFYLVLALSILIRIYGAFTPAHTYDIDTYHAWGNLMLEKGPADFFASTWSDYLPLPIYFLVPIVIISQNLGLTFGLVFKLLISFFELFLLLKIFVASPKSNFWIFSIFLFLSPALIGDSAFWGQLDTIPALLTLLSLQTLRKNHILGAVYFGLATSFKPIMLLALPFLLFLTFRRNKKNALIFSLVSFSVFLLPGFPASPLHPFQFLFDKAVEQAGTYPYTTINAWNFWSLKQTASAWPSDNLSILGISGKFLGYFLFLQTTLLNFLNWKRRQFKSTYLPLIIGSVFVNFYVFTTRMHERHLLFGLPFLALAASFSPSIIIPTSFLTLTYIANLYAAYLWSADQIWPVSFVFIRFVSSLNVLIALFLSLSWDWLASLRSFASRFFKNIVLSTILLFALSVRLVNLSYPTQYIFDEVYHAFTARELLNNNISAWEWWTTPPPGVAYEWTHPPLAKYFMVAGMLVAGENSLGWRLPSALFGALSVLGLYLLVQSVWHNRRLALLSSFLLTLEGLHLSQSRIAMNDIFMLTFLLWALYLAVKSRFKLASLAWGLALSSKWSAVYGLVPLAVIFLHSFPHTFFKLKSILHAIRLIMIALIVYVLTFTPFIVAGHTWGEWWELQRQMWHYHTHLVATHAYQSTPLDWIFSLRPVWYFVEYGEKLTNIYAQGNPPLLWLGLVALISSLIYLRRYKYFLFYVLYASFVVPWIFSPRIMFFYHYLPSSVFLCVLLSAWLLKLPRALIYVFVGFIVLGFLLSLPLHLGFPMPSTYWNSIFHLIPSWK
ncbi:MAG: Dolichyl-phosphate-mannose-protein mannosyltransferase family protein [Microgenomates group bacterium GW2011_GWF2_47_9]|nr:MAG: Dolichyl-phosphate-mannose-protein mannosyltransferase family protein [Microgenomates group bacterium GW2011_GWF2_47_9]